MTASSGNTLAFRVSGSTGDGAGPTPIVVLESGMATTAEHWEWIVSELATRFPTVTYQRAGYGRSTYVGSPNYHLDVALSDLVDLVGHVADERPVLLVGHSLGGYLALKASNRLQGPVLGVGLLDASHPGELQRSSQQAEGQRVLGSSLDLLPASMGLGLGVLLERPDWLDQLPEHVRPLALAQYRDARVWAAARREWRAVEAEFGAYDGETPRIDVPVLSVTAGQTALQDPIQKDLHDELADAAPWAERHVLEGVDHQQLLVDSEAALRVAELLVSFADGVRGDRRERTKVDGLR